MVPVCKNSGSFPIIQKGSTIFANFSLKQTVSGGGDDFKYHDQDFGSCGGFRRESEDPSSGGTLLTVFFNSTQYY